MSKQQALEKRNNTANRNKLSSIQRAEAYMRCREITYFKAVKMMKSKFGLEPNSRLAVNSNFPVQTCLKDKRFIDHKTSLIFSNQRVYSLMSNPKVVYNAAAEIYQPKRQAPENKNIAIKTSYYCVSYDDGPIIFKLDDLSKYKYDAYISYNKDLAALTSNEEPYDFSIYGTFLLGNNLTPFDVYRLDKNAQQEPHQNRMNKDQSMVLKKFYPIFGSHEHIYTETFATIYYDAKYSTYDAVALTPKDNKGQLISKKEALEHVQNLFSVNLSLISSGSSLKEAFKNPEPKPFSYSNIEITTHFGK